MYILPDTSNNPVVSISALFQFSRTLTITFFCLISFSSDKYTGFFCESAFPLEP